MKTSLKAKNLPYITGWLIFQSAFAFMLFDHSIALTEILTAMENLSFTGVSLTIAAVFTLLLNYLIPSRIKDFVVFLKFEHTLPSCRVFSDLIHKDNRIDIKLLKRKHGLLPTIPIEQNLLWGKIYRGVRKDNSIINDSHGKWLLMRDITTIALILLIITCVFYFFQTAPQDNSIRNVIILLLSEYVLFMIAARNAGNRFVENVIIEDISKTFYEDK